MVEGSEELEDFEDFDDSFLKEVACSEASCRMPVPGTWLGGPDERRFEVLDSLGGGAMGQVFRARDAELQRVVALKFFLPRGLAGEQEALGAMLRQEARAIAQLDHENIVRIFDVGEWSGAPWEPRVPFLVMEYLDGESLGSLLERERPEPRRALGIMRDVARGLAHAHERHLVHRDLKPNNVFLTRQGPVKLLDFGLAHLMGSQGAVVPHLPTAGTPPHMAPEQWRGEPQDARTDLWAAGVMLFELLTGELPYPSVDLEELRSRVLSPAPVPSVRERAPELPEEVARLVALALEKEPSRRLSSAAELAERLEGLVAQLGPWLEAPLSLGPQRRQVTLVSCGVLGLEQLPERPDPEDSLEMEEDFHRRCSQVLQRHGGFVAHLLGGEVLACFGYPVAREGDSERAVRAGLELRESFQREPPRLPGHPLSVGVGVHTDSVVISVSPQQSPGAGPAIQGEAPRVAAALAERAGPGGVVLGASTWTLVRGAFETEPLGTEAWRVLRERVAVTRFERVLATGNVTRLVGRERELQTLLARWREAKEGRGSFVLVSGEAGIGKSRLIQELIARVSPEPVALVPVQCWPQLQSSAFAPVIELLWRLLPPEARTLPRRELRGLLESWLGARGLLREPGQDARYLDSLVSLLLPVSEEEPPSLGLARLLQGEGRRWLLEAMGNLLWRMSAQRPVLYVVEDLHWADPSTLELLGSLMEHVGRERLLAVLSARTGFVPPWPSRPELHRLELGPLSPESTALLVREMAKGRELPEERVAQLVARTEGVPLFIEELMRLVLERAPASIPVTLHELLASRLDALPPQQRALLWFGAGVGRRFTGALLAALTHRSEAELRRNLEALVSAGILERDESAGAGYQFHHALLQEVAWQSLPRGRRREFHRHIAQVLEARFPEVVATRPEVLAHHYTEAGALERALEYRRRAVNQALQRWAHLEAVEHLRQALALLRALPDASRRAGEEMYLLNKLGVALTATQGYGSPELERIHARALELFEQQGESLPYLGLMWSWLSSYFLTGGRLSLAQELAERLLTLGQHQGRKMPCAVAYMTQSRICCERGELVRSLELYERYKALSRDVSTRNAFFGVFGGNLWVEQDVFEQSFLSVLLVSLGDVRGAKRCNDEMVARARRLNLPISLIHALSYAAGVAQNARDVPHTLEWTEEVLRLASQAHLPPYEAPAKVFRGWALARLGRRQEGLAVLRDGFEQSRLSVGHEYLSYYQGLLAEVQGSLGQVGEGLASVEAALAHARELGIHFGEPELYRIRGGLLRMRGEDEEAMRCFLQARVLARHQGAALFELRATVSLARLLRDAGHVTRARRRLVRALHASRVDPEAVDFQDVKLLLERLSPRPEEHAAH